MWHPRVLHRSRFYIAVGAVTLIAAANLQALSSFGKPVPTSRPEGHPLGRLTDAELIDRLQEITNAEFAVRTNIIAVGPGTAMPQGQLMKQDAALTVIQAKEELVRRGVAAMPVLLAHLDDARKTKASVQGMMGLRYTADYDKGPLFANNNPTALGTPAANKGPQKEYTFAVGDICFNIIGEIVNRHFEAVKYVPSAIVMVNSPVLNPEVCAAARKEWSDLTPEKHRESLVQDVTAPSNAHGVQGFKTLMRYYPDAAPAALRAHLKIPHYSLADASPFILEILSKPSTPEERKKIIDDFAASHGEAFRDILIIQLWQQRKREKGSFLASQGRLLGEPPKPNLYVVVTPLEILKELYPKFDPDVAPVFNSIDVVETTNLLRSLDSTPSPELDMVVWEAFQKYATNHGAKWDRYTDELAGVCIPRLAHKGHDEKLLAFCEGRKKELVSPGVANTRKLDAWIAAVSAPSGE